MGVFMTYEQRVLALATIKDPDHPMQRYVRDKDGGKFWWDRMVTSGWAASDPHRFFEDTTVYTVTDAGVAEALRAVG